MDIKNNFIRDFHGITKFHESGYFGKHCVVGTGEDIGSNNAHAQSTLAYFKEFAPEAEVIYLPAFGMMDETFMSEQIKTMIDRRVSCWWASLKFSGFGDNLDKAFEKVKDFCTMFNAIGNDSAESYSQLTRAKWIYGVGAYRLEGNTPIPEGFSSESTELDFCGADDGFVFGSKTHGTSYGCPMLCAMATLVNDFFIDKTGKPLSSAMMYQFLKDHSYDFYESGKDTKTGWGYVKLPEPSEIDIKKYQPDYVVNDDMTGEEIVDKINEYLLTLSYPDWAKNELQEAVSMGITDGTRPMQFIPRYQNAIMEKRAIK